MNRAQPNLIRIPPRATDFPRDTSNFGFLLCSLSLLLLFLLEASAHGVSPAPWEKARQLSDFQSLLQRSPFSLPTAEETSPLAERFALTGIVNIGGEEEVFVFDRNDQSRTLITHTPNTNNIALVSLLREGDRPPQQATIRVGEETGTIGYLESANSSTALKVVNQPAPGSPASAALPGPQGIQFPHLPSLPQLPQQTASANYSQTNSIQPSNRRIIRRPLVIPSQTQSSTP